MSKLSRRQVVFAGGAALAAPFISGNAAFSRYVTQTFPLPLPGLIEPKNGETVTLTMAMARHGFDPTLFEKKALSAGINADYLGPVVRLTKGTDVNFQVQNRLGDITTMHWHGLFVPSLKDGGPHNIIQSGGDWNVPVHVDQPSSLNWFHPHVHQNTAYQAHLGLAGLMIVDDGNDRERGLPSTYGVDDFPLVLQDRRVIEGDKVYEPDFVDLIHGFHGDKLIVNGTRYATASVPRSIVRLRMLNGANARIFNLSFENNLPFHVIASDGGYLVKPVETATLQIAPGERYEVLVDFSKGQEKTALYTSSFDDGSGEKLKLMAFSCKDDLKGAITAIPQTLDDPGKVDSAQAVQRRKFLMDDRIPANKRIIMEKILGQGDSRDQHVIQHMMMNGGEDHSMAHGGRSTEQTGKAMTAATSGFSMAIAGETFDMNRIDVKAKKGSYEVWELSTTGIMSHAFHIHGASFRVLSLDGKAPQPWLTGWKDTVLVNKSAELLVHFNRDADEKHPFMFHCHTLEHEDLGMMGQFITI